MPSIPLGTVNSGITATQGIPTSSLTSPYTNVLSAMLGHVPGGSLQPAFPGLLPSASVVAAAAAAAAGVTQGPLSSAPQPTMLSEDNSSSDDGKDDSQGTYT